MCVCVYVYGSVQYTLGDGERFPWQQLECCMDRSDVDVFVHACEVMCVCVCVPMLSCGGQTRTVYSRHFIAYHTSSESQNKTSFK